MTLGNAGESGSQIASDVEKYLVKGYLPTIGIECHVQLATKTKLFSGVDNDAREAEPNSKVSAVDYALPGMLPYLNKEAIRLAARAGRALNSEIAHESRFDRKHYFYPDLPKGYQISQMYQPIIVGGFVNLPSRKSEKTGETWPETKVRIHHAHLEEDAGKLTHFSDYSLVDLNRAGTPLIEIVAEPDIHSAAEARSYAEELHGLMTFAGVTLGDLYYGNMRFDVNISVAKPNEDLGTRAEIKNLNSFRSVEKAVEYEIKRQIEILEKGEKIVQETRGWLDDSQKTFSQRSKEDAQDYRYMPDADIPPVILTSDQIAEMQADMPILPPEYRAKFAVLDVDDSVIAVLLRDQKIAELISEISEASDAKAFEPRDSKSVVQPENFSEAQSSPSETLSSGQKLEKERIKLAKNIVNLFVSTLPAEDEEAGATDDVKVLPSAENLISLAKMFANKEISSTAQKEIFAEMMKKDADPKTIAEAKNLLQVSDENAISKIVDEVLSSPQCAKAVADFQSGNEKVIGFLVGQAMKASKGAANPSLAQKLIREKLAE